MNRRGFFASLAALVAAPFVPTPKATTLTAAVWRGPEVPTVLVDRETNISIRLIRQWEANGRLGFYDWYQGPTESLGVRILEP